jgi:DNA-binding IclR family transcriptional regulator
MKPAASRKVLSRYHVPNLDRALDLVELLSVRREGLCLSDASRELKISSNMAYRVALTLEARGYLERDPESKRYRLGGKLLGLGTAAADRRSLVDAAWPVLKKLRDAVRESVFVGCRYGDEGVVLETLPGLEPFVIDVHPGTRYGLPNTAPGKSLLAFSEDRDRLLRKLRIPRLTRRTITDRRALAREIDRVRKFGYSTDDGEFHDGIRCVAAPVFDAEENVAGVLWTVAPAVRLPRRTFHRLGKIFVAHAAEVSRRLGSREQ